MKILLITLMMVTASFTAQAQTKPADSAKSARDYVIDNENKRTTTPNQVKPSIKTIHPAGEQVGAQKKQRSKKCCLFCKKKNKSSVNN